MSRCQAGAFVPVILASALLWTGCTETVARERPLDSGPQRSPAQERESLVVEAEQPSSDPEILRQRLEVLWRWSEAFVLDGGLMGPDYPLEWGVAYRAATGAREPLEDRSRPIGRLVDPERGVTMERVSDFVRDSVRELALKQTRPRALATLTLSQRGPFLAGDAITLVQTLTVGDQPMRPGSRLLLAQRRTGLFQLDEPTAPGFTTVVASRRDARLVREPISPRWWSSQIDPEAAFRIEGAALEPGDRVTITYGDRTQGSTGMHVPTGSVDEISLPVFVDLDGAGNMMRMAWPTFAVVGRREAAFVNAVAPSLVRPGQPFVLAIRSEDAFKNPVSGPAPAYEVRLGANTVAQVAAGGDAVALLDGLSIATPGVHRFEVRSADGALAGRANPVVVGAEIEGRLLWGDTHGHTNLAEGRGSPDGYFRFGRDVARLDFLTLSEHDVWTDALEWRVLQDRTEAYLDPGRFTTILGYEWTAYVWNGGHHNVYFRTTVGRERVSHQQVPDLARLYGGLRRINDPDDVLVVPHAHMPGDWRRSDAAMERLVEISSGHGGWEWFGNRYLENGFRVGFIGSSDNHDGHPGYSVGTSRQLGGLAAVFASENSRDAVFDALRALRCYATTGERIVLVTDLDGTPMGQEASLSAERRLRARVHGTQPIDSIEVVKNGDVVWSQRYLTTRVDRRARVQIVFESATEVHGDYGALGRRQRDWTGWIELRGAKLDDVTLPWYHDPRSDRMTRDAKAEHRLAFSFNTRGRGKGFVLALDGATADTEVIVHIDASVADTRQILEVPPEHFPEQHLAHRLGELAGQGAAIHQLRSGPNTDRIEVQLVDAAGPLDQQLEWNDLGERRAGDWYYVRVRQIDGSMAWSSPIWAGRAPLAPDIEAEARE
jgi:hypothetical protein